MGMRVLPELFHRPALGRIGTEEDPSGREMVEVTDLVRAGSGAVPIVEHRGYADLLAGRVRGSGRTYRRRTPARARRAEEDDCDWEKASQSGDSDTSAHAATTPAQRDLIPFTPPGSPGPRPEG